jgi:hypothetical protein
MARRDRPAYYRFMLQRLLLLPVFCGAMLAQNSDLGVLAGVGTPASATISGTRISGSVRARLQINYAAQLKETPAGRLYLELPFLIGGNPLARIDSGGIYGSSGSTIYFTPGVRWNLPLHSRVSLYAATGVGVAGFFGNRATVVGKQVTASSGSTASFAGALGGGFDVRLSRLISLRGEVRDFISRKGVNGIDGRHDVIFGAGVGFHW